MNRVVITGIGCRTPIGNDYSSVKDSFFNGKYGNKKSLFNSSAYVVSDDIDLSFDKFDLNITDRFTRLAWLSYLDAKTESKIAPEGILLGVGYGGGAISYEDSYRDLFAKGKVKTSALIRNVVNMGANFIALRDNILGPAFTYSTACASASTAIGEAYKKIAYGEYKSLAAGGTEACINELQFAYWRSMYALSDDCKPFSTSRNGITLSEGSVIFILEEYNSAIDRNAHIYAEIVGYGVTNGSESLTKPSTPGQIRSMEKSLEGLSKEDVTYINAHGTGTPVGDIVELQSIAEVFGSLTKNIPVSSTKNLHGHLFGAAGAIEMLACISVLEYNKIIPNWYLDDIDEHVPENINLPTYISTANQNIVLNNSFGFGGTNITLAMTSVN